MNKNKNRENKYPETDVFCYYNANPKQRITFDCVIRAISAFTGDTWADTYRQMVEVAIKHAVSHDGKDGIKHYMNSKGYVMHKMPRRADNSRYTAAEFCREIAVAGNEYVLSLAGHLAYVDANQRVRDIWDCTGKSVGNYWVRKS